MDSPLSNLLAMPFLPACFSPLRIFSVPPKKIPVTPIVNTATPISAPAGDKKRGVIPPPRRRHPPPYSPNTHRRTGALGYRQSMIKQENAKKAFRRHQQKAARPMRTPVAPAVLSRIFNDDFVPFETIDQAVSSLMQTGADTSAEDLIMAQQLKALGRERSIHNRIDAERDLVERARKDAPAMNLAREKKTAIARKRQVRAAAEAVEEARKKRGARRFAGTQQRYNRWISGGIHGRVNVEKRPSRFRVPWVPSYYAKARREADGLAGARGQQEGAHAAHEALRQELNRQAIRRAVEERREAERQAHLRWEELLRIRQVREAAELARRQEEERLQAQQREQERLQNEKVANEKHFLEEYELKWNVLKTDEEIPVIYFYQVPWPLVTRVQSFDDFTAPAISYFVQHPLRAGFEGKTPRERVKAEIRRWHPDKFNTKVLPRVFPEHTESAKDAAGRVVRILTQMLGQLDH